MEQDKLVSAIITTYNREFWMLERAIKSVLNQTYKNIEIIVVDDNDEEKRKKLKLEEKIRKYSQVKYIKHIVNKGLSEARNTGIKNSNGFYIAFLDDDDEWLKNKIELQIKQFDLNDEDVGLVNSSYIKVNVDDNKEEIIYAPNIRGFGLNELLEKGNYLLYPMIKKDCFDKCGLFDSSLRHSEDFEMWVRILEKYKVDCINVPTAKYYFHGNENMTFNYNDFINASINIERKHEDIYLKNVNGLWCHISARAKAYAHMHKPKGLFDNYIKCISIKPLSIYKNVNLFIKLLVISLFK